MKSPSAISPLMAPIATPSVSVGRMIEIRGNLLAERNGHGSGMIKLVWKSSEPKLLSLGKTRLVLLGSVRGDGNPLPG